MTINIAHLYPDLLNLYGDKGNILSLQYRCIWRGIEANVTKYGIDDEIDFENTDIIYIGGGTDKEQKTVCERLAKYKDQIKDFVENDGTVIGICGGYHLLGNKFCLGDEIIDGLGVLDIETRISKSRFVGNVIVKTDFLDMPVVGFENHTTVAEIGDLTPLGNVIFGSGNTDGVIYKNVFATNIHGPLLPKNPQLCDEIIKRTLAKKYSEANLTPLDDTIENDANSYIYNRFIK